MINSQKEMMAVKFAECMGRLKLLGLKGDVSVTAGVVMIATTCKSSAPVFRKAIKTACRSGILHVENRPSKGSYVFTITC